MATIINNPGNSEDSSGVSLIVGVILAVVLLFAFFAYAVPAMRGTAPAENNNGGAQIKVELPAPAPAAEPAPANNEGSAGQ